MSSPPPQEPPPDGLPSPGPSTLCTVAHTLCHPAVPAAPEAAKEPTLTPASTATDRKPDPTAALPGTGTAFDDYELLQQVGRGGMGVVYKARQKSLDRIVALKLLPAGHIQDKILVARFLTEARTTAALDHHNIIRVYQVGECAAGQYLAMEFIDGQTLEAYLQRKRLTVPSAVTLVIRLAEAVHYAHTQGVVHRDLKPGNIMIDTRGRPVIMDFGLAKVLGEASGLTRQGDILGTPCFMAAEQAGEGAGEIGPWSDVYSLGAILYSALTGQNPYSGDSVYGVLVKVLRGEPPEAIRKIQPGVPAVLETICLRCLNRQPKDRYPSAQALADDLRRFRSGKTEKNPASSTQRAAAPKAPFLVVARTGQRIPLVKSSLVIGRGEGCEIRLRSAAASKQHCRLTVGEKSVTVEDLGSANGTRVNGRPVTRARRMREGDQFELAGHVFELHFPGS